MMKAVLLCVGIVLLAHSFAVAYAMRDALQADHHKRSSGASALSAFPHISLATASQGSGEKLTAAAGDIDDGAVGASLPLYVMLEVVVGALLVLFGGFGSLFTLHDIRRKSVAATQSYDEAFYSGADFVHFNHRGRVACATAAK